MAQREVGKMPQAGMIAASSAMIHFIITSKWGFSNDKSGSRRASAPDFTGDL